MRALILTATLHLGTVALIVLSGFTHSEEAPPMIVEAALVEMAKLGDIPPDPKALVRIEAKAAAEEVPEEAPSLSRRLKTDVPEKKRKKDKPKKQNKEKRKKKPKKKPRQERPKKKLSDLSSLLDDEIEDERADVEDRRIGFKEGHQQGRSHDPNALRRTYAFELSAALRPRLKVPEVIPKAMHAQLQTKVHFSVTKDGKVRGTPKIIESSGNELFDHAALNAINYFGSARPGKLPMPKDQTYLRQILNSGITTNMRPAP